MAVVWEERLKDELEKTAPLEEVCAALREDLDSQHKRRLEAFETKMKPIIIRDGPSRKVKPLSHLSKATPNKNVHGLQHHFLSRFFITLHMAHLSKGTSDLKQKCTQLATPFSGTVFHALSHGMIHFVRSVRSRNHFLIG